MSRGLFLKALRELWPATALFAILIGLVEAVLSYVLPTFQEQFAAGWAQLQFAKTIIRAMMGTDTAGVLGPEMFHALGWVHPVVVAITWAHAIAGATRVPAGEVDRGTIDVLLGLPVSRWEVYVSETAAWAATGLVVLGFAWAGNLGAGLALPPALRPDPSRVAIAVTNLLCLYLAVGGVASLVSSLSDRRGKAMTVVFVIVLASFLLNYLAQFWEPARRVRHLSLLYYHRPLFALRDGAWPLGDMAVLSSIACGTWLAGGLVFARRDLSTV